MKRFIAILLITLFVPLAGAVGAEPEKKITGLTAEAIDDGQRIVLTWSASTTPAVSYRVYRSTSASSNGTVVKDFLNVLTYTDETGSYNTAYYYRVGAVFGGQVSELSDPVLVKKSLPVPVSVEAKDLTLGKQIKITWDRPTLGLPLKYNIYRSVTDSSLGSSVGSNVADTEYVDKTAANGVSYSYRVKSVYGSILSDQSPAANAVATDTVPPAAPSKAKAKAAANNKATISWSAPSGETGLRYIIYRSHGNNAVGDQVGESKTTSFSDSLPIGNSAYYYRVAARDAANNESLPSDPAILTVGALAPKVPIATDFKVAPTGASGQLKLTWRNPSIAFSYARIYRGLTSEAGSLLADKIKGSSYIDKNLANGQKYFYTVRLVDKDSKEHDASNVAGALPYKQSKAVVPPPSQLAAADLGKGSAIRLSWYIAALRDQSHVNIYRSEIATSTGSLLVGGITGTSYDDKNLIIDKRYFYTIKAVNKDGIESVKNIPLAAMATVATSTDSAVDTDQDGLPDVWEKQNGYSPLSKDNTSADEDKDGLVLREEYKLGSNSWVADTDSDGYSDGAEVKNGYDPLGPGRKVVAKTTAAAGQFAYGKARINLAQEKVLAQELANELKKELNNRNLPYGRASWFKLVNAYIYGGYSAHEIANTVRLGLGQVHPAIPAEAWRKSAEYKRAVR